MFMSCHATTSRFIIFRWVSTHRCICPTYEVPLQSHLGHGGLQMILHFNRGRDLRERHVNQPSVRHAINCMHIG